MRVLLVYSNRSRLLEPVPPIGLSYVATAARDAGHEVRIVDFMVARNPFGKLRRSLAEFCPEVVGVSVRNIDSVIPQRLAGHFEDVGRILHEVRRAGNSKIVLGGPAISVLKGAVLERFDADFAVVGEGEESFPRLLEAVASGESPGGIPGICHRVDGEIVEVPPIRAAHFGASDMQGWVNWPRYEQAGGTFAIHTKRGCPMGCVYCNYPGLEGKRSRFREAGEVVDEIECALRAVGPRTFEFTDTTFNLPEEHAVLICEEILRRGLRVGLSAVGVNPLGITPRLIDLMKRAGFINIIVSADAGNDAMLANLGKGFTMEHVREAARLVKASGIRSSWFFLFGGPGETLETVDETLEFAVANLDAPGLLVVAMTGVRVLPSTPLAMQLVRDGVLNHDVDFARPLFYFSPGLDERQVLDRVQAAIGRLPSMVHGGEESGSPIERGFYEALRIIGKKPPYLRYLPDLLRLPPMRWLRAAGSPVPSSPPGFYIGRQSPGVSGEVGCVPTS